MRVARANGNGASQHKVANKGQFDSSKFTGQSCQYEFEQKSAQIVPYWPIWPLLGRRAPLPLPSATGVNSLVFEYANDNIHLPMNPLGVIVNGL